MLLDAIRKLIPIRVRQDLGLWTIREAGKSKWLLYPYFFLLCGCIPKNIRLLPHDLSLTVYKGHEIISPRDGILAFWEVLQDAIYERYHSPQLNDVVLDVGAYVGMFAVKAALQVGEKGKVIAIEPATSNLRWLYRNTRGFENIMVTPMAAGERDGEGELAISEASPCHNLSRQSGMSEKVLVTKLDSLVKDLKLTRVDFIKMDAEGSEPDILRGALNILKEYKPKLAIASYHNLPNGECELPYVRKILEDAGYQVKVIKNYIYAEAE